MFTIRLKPLIFTVLLLCLTSFAQADFQQVYWPAKTQIEQPYAADLKNGQVLEKLTAALNRFLKVDDRIEITAKSCGTPNAFYDSRFKSITLCYELLAFNDAKLKRFFKNKLPSQQLYDVYNAELIFVVLHEVGHGMIDIYKLPVLGREEDAADKFAAFMLLNYGGEKVLKRATLFFQDTAIAKFDKFVDQKWAQINGASSVYGDEHSLDQQRLANLVCWGYGKNQTEFFQLVEQIKLPPRRASMCSEETEKMNRDIKALFGERLNVNASPTSTANATPQPSIPTVNKDAALAVAQKYACTVCHKMDERLIGPSMKELSAKFRGTSIDTLASKVRRGSSGQWGAIPMPPQQVISDDELRTVLTWLTAN